MKLRLDIASNTLLGTTLLDTENTSGKNLDELWFTVYPNCFRSSDSTPAPPEAYFAGFNPGGLHFDYITINGQAVKYSEKGASIQVKAASSIRPGDAIEVDMG